MAGRKYDNYTVLGFDESNPIEKRCKEFLNSLGKAKKGFILALCKLNFPDFFEDDGKTPIEIKDIIEKYRQPYQRKDYEDPIFIGWQKEYGDQAKMLNLLNTELGNGCKDFIVEILTSSLPLLSNDSFKAAPIPKKAVTPRDESIIPKKNSSPINKEITPSPAPAQAQLKPVQETQELDDEEKALLELANDFTSAMDGSTKVNDNASTDSTSDTYTDELGFRFKKKG